MKALILVDIQIDFCQGGALEVKGGDDVVAIANLMMPYFDKVVATQDWHPADHGSFAANHPWRKPGQIIELDGLSQVLWPIHCVQGSFGAEFHPQLEMDGIDKVFHKGMDRRVDSYSGFFDNGKRKTTGLSTYLKNEGIKTVFVMGLATDYCVKFTTFDAIDEGFDTYLIVDGCRGVELNPGDVSAALEQMQSVGVKCVQSDKIMAGLV